jgi:hypothetical protein
MTNLNLKNIYSQKKSNNLFLYFKTEQQIQLNVHIFFLNIRNFISQLVAVERFLSFFI